MKRLLTIFLVTVAFIISTVPVYAQVTSAIEAEARGKIILPRTTVAIAAAGTSFTVSPIFLYNFANTRIGYRATRYILEVPNMTNAVTTTFSIVDANSVTVYTGAALAENANYSVPIDVEMVGTYTLTLTLSGVAGAGGGTAYLTIFGE